MARKALKKSAAKAKKKPAAVTKKKGKTKRKTAAKNKSKTAARNKLAARKKPARKAKPKNKPKGVIANIVADFNRDSPDDSRIGADVRGFPAFRQDRSEFRTATVTSDGPNGGRGADLAIFAGIWTHSSHRQLLNA